MIAAEVIVGGAFGLLLLLTVLLATLAALAVDAQRRPKKYSRIADLEFTVDTLKASLVRMEKIRAMLERRLEERHAAVHGVVTRWIRARDLFEVEPILREYGVGVPAYDENSDAFVPVELRGAIDVMHLHVLVPDPTGPDRIWSTFRCMMSPNTIHRFFTSAIGGAGQGYREALTHWHTNMLQAGLLERGFEVDLVEVVSDKALPACTVRVVHRWNITSVAGRLERGVRRAMFAVQHRIEPNEAFCVEILVHEPGDAETGVCIILHGHFDPLVVVEPVEEH